MEDSKGECGGVYTVSVGRRDKKIAEAICGWLPLFGMFIVILLHISTMGKMLVNKKMLLF
jgi:hypothetical protein